MPSLAGKRVIVTRAAHQAEELARPLRDLGATVLLVPMIEIAPPSDPSLLRDAVIAANEYDWILFTSANAVDSFGSALQQTASSIRPKIAVIGRATAERARAVGFAVSLEPEESVSENLAAELIGRNVGGCKILLPSAAVTRDVVAAELKRNGAQVDVVEAYRSVLPADSEFRAAAAFSGAPPDWVTFASPSAVNNLVGVVGVSALADCHIASIGPITSSAIRKHGVRVDVEAVPHTVQAMASAMASFNQNL